MGKKISELAAASALVGTELIELVQSGVNVQALIGALLPPGYIEGLRLIRPSATALTITTGAAYIPSLGRVVRLSADVALTGLALAASTWYHAYLYVNAGVASVELVTTAPAAAAYNGTARTKNGDTSRRYVGSVLTDASGNLYAFRMRGTSIAWKNSVAAAPFLVASAGRATTPTNVSCSGVVPVTGVEATMILAMIGTGADAPLGTSDMTGTLSASNYLQYLAGGVQTTHTMALDASQAFNYLLTASVATGGFYARVTGYTFER